ncbi:MAG: hypothetical protein JO100_00410, partial [Pseudonocardia sp.]|nr:hypothetical protein [Pseudonocardia sp.]
VIPLHAWEMYDDQLVHFGTITGTYRLTTRADITTYLEQFTKLEPVTVFDTDARAILTRVVENYRALNESHPVPSTPPNPHSE